MDDDYYRYTEEGDWKTPSWTWVIGLVVVVALHESRKLPEGWWWHWLQVAWGALQVVRTLAFRWNPREVAEVLEPMPDLVVGDTTEGVPTNGGTSTPELEPAFLHDKDYPPGWMVYHPVLGVVAKEKADEFDREKKKR